MSSNVDLELKKAFQGLQVQVIETRDKVRQIDIQMEALRRSSHHSKLTKNEIIALPQDCNLYESLGRMFVKRDSNQINKLLDDRINTNEEKIKALQQSKTYAESKVKESENNLRELIAHKKLNQ
jgi:prefoldin subunit 1